MLHTPLWTLLCALPRGRAALAPHERRLLTARLRAGALQPVNALVFVYDGLIYAVRAFGFLRNALLLGVCCTFAPALALAKSLSPSSLLAFFPLPLYTLIHSNAHTYARTCARTHIHTQQAAGDAVRDDGCLRFRALLRHQDRR